MSPTTKLTRDLKWESLLDKFFLENMKRPFVWGEWDCGLFAAGAIQVMTGVDLAEPYRGRYSDEAGARALGSAESIAESIGLQECPPNFAHRGDLVLLSNTPDPCLGILGMDGRAVMVTDNGLTFLKRTRILRSWHV
jgi:hypothetical protein